jgi:ribosomal peptide maturation radical SAM protein 1
MLALVSMPWSFPERPSAALASLAAFVRRERPLIALTCDYAYVECAADLGFDGYRAIAEAAYVLGEPLYQPLLYPHRVDAAREQFVRSAAKRFLSASDLRDGANSLEAVFDWLIERLDAHADLVVARLAQFSIVGLTTCFGQLFANLVVAKRLKALAPETTVILGGSTVSGRVGPSILSEYPFVDYIAQGEGERPLVALLDTLLDGKGERPVPGVIAQRVGSGEPAELTEIARMDDLPYPDFDEYAEVAERHGLEWSLAIEGSRGCWWDRTKKAKSAAATCYFCNLNVQWNGYREKSVSRVASELETLSDRYGVLDVYFLDNIIRARGAGELARRIQGLGRDFRVFYELRANLSQEELMLLWQAGLNETQFGIEGLSTSYLRRVGKGTTTIQNLSAMKTCEELGVMNLANLIAYFPGGTEEEVDETARNIERYAIAYRPLNIANFNLGVESTVEVLRERFGIRNVRNSESVRGGLPDDVFDRLKLFDLSFDSDTPTVSWDKVFEAVEAWRSRYDRMSERMLMYQDAGSFLRIVDLRSEGRASSGMLRGIEREVYLHCCDIRSQTQLMARFPTVPQKDLDEMLKCFVAEDLMFEENGRFLSLAMAKDARAAAARIASQAVHVAKRRALPTLEVSRN